MKPTFALDLTSERIALLHRSGRGWAEVGAVDFADPDIDGALAVLRATAAEMSPKGITTKLILPDSQILYTTVPVTGATDAARRAEVAAALEGATPYAVADLAFDISAVDGGMVAVAAVARETLEQAEGFASQHRLNPVSFVGEAAAGWPTEPYFGTTSVAGEILGKGGRVTRDTLPVLLRSPEAVPVAAPEVAAEAAPEAATFASAETADEGPAPEAQVHADADATAPSSLPADPSDTTGLAPGTDDVALAGAGGSAEAALGTTPDAPPAAEPAAVLSFTAPKPAPEADEAPFTHVADGSVPDLPAAPPGDLPPAPAPAMMVAFASRRANTAPKAAPPPGTVAERLAQRAAALSQTSRVVPPAPPRNFSAFEPATTRRRIADSTDAPPRTEPSATLPPASVPPAADAAGAAVTATLPATASLPRMQPALPRKSLTKPGGTFATSAPARGRTRYLGLILTGVLLAFLALVAAWASFFLEAQNGTGGGEDATPVASTGAAPDLPQTTAAVTAPDPVADLAAPPPAVDLAAAPAGDPAITEPAGAVPDLPPADTVAVAPDPVDPVAAGPPPAGVPSETTSAALPAPVQDGGDRIVVSAPDSAPTPPDAPGLAAAPLAADAPPAAQLPPPAFGTVYQFDAAGRIIPTPEGILTPDGVRLVAGPPPVVPPLRPEAVTAAAAASALPPTAPSDAPAAVPPDGVTAVGADPALAGARPRVRPVELAPPPATADDASLPEAGATRLASPRPPARPAALAAAAAEATAAAAAAAAAEEQARRDAASLAAQAAAEAAVEAVVSDAAVAAGSPLAVAVSRVPAPRPRSLERAVAAAVTAATRAPPPAEAVPQAEVEDEPELASAAPSTPTRANVADQATFSNALSLREINLIGVYGTDANRRALVRQANGRYREVEVGDRLDGGVVAAITVDELRYQKGGRLVSLEMPEG